LNGATVVFQNTGAGPLVNYDSVTNTLTFDVDPTTTTANDLITLAAGDPTVSQNFTLSLANTDPGNNGNGALGALPPATTLSGGQGQTLTAADTNPIQVQGAFSALVNLRNALQSNNTDQIQAAVNMLTQASTTVDSAQADLGVRLQTISNLSTNLQTQQVNLQSAASNDLSANIAQVISDLLGAQTSLQASLEATGMISQLTLLNYVSLNG
jgi:flagellin-like hook-associated protein FlgL